jgi:hypothetical protein
MVMLVKKRYSLVIVCKLEWKITNGYNHYHTITLQRSEAQQCFSKKTLSEKNWKSVSKLGEKGATLCM